MRDFDRRYDESDEELRKRILKNLPPMTGTFKYYKYLIHERIVPETPLGIQLTVTQNVKLPEPGEVVFVILSRPPTKWQRLKLRLAAWLTR